MSMKLISSIVVVCCIWCNVYVAGKEEKERNYSPEVEQKAQETMMAVMKSLTPQCRSEMEVAMETKGDMSDECKQEVQKALTAKVGEALKGMDPDARERVLKENPQFKDAEQQAEHESDAQQAAESKAQAKKARAQARKEKAEKVASDRARTLYTIFSFVAFCILGLLGACFYINRQLNDAGLYQPNERKKLSAKKLAKQKAKAF